MFEQIDTGEPDNQREESPSFIYNDNRHYQQKAAIHKNTLNFKVFTKPASGVKRKGQSIRILEHGLNQLKNTLRPKTQLSNKHSVASIESI